MAFARTTCQSPSLARLVIAPHLAPAYQNIVYLDGDIQIVGDVTPLVRHRVRDGWIAAGRGSAWFDPDDRLGLNPTGYFDALNGATRDSYFNAGVLACRETPGQFTDQRRWTPSFATAKHSFATTKARSMPFFSRMSNLSHRPIISTMRMPVSSATGFCAEDHSFHRPRQAMESCGPAMGMALS